MVQVALLDEYESGWAAIRGKKVFYVRTPSGEEIEFGSSARVSNRRRARVFAALCVNLGPLPMHSDPEVVPVKVAAAGKPEIASYLMAVHQEHYTPEDQYKPREISDVLNVSYDSVSAYWRRVIRSVEDQKVAGVGW